MNATSRAIKRHATELEAELAEARAQTNFWENKYTELEIELRETRATLRQSLQHRDTLRADLAEARAQIAALQAFKDEDANEEAVYSRGVLDGWDQARAQIAAKDAALDALDEAHQITQQNLWQDITELRASLASKEQEHQDFRLQNDAEWRAKLDHLKAQIAAKDAELLAQYEKVFELEHQLDLAAIDAEVFAKLRARIAELEKANE